MLQIIILIAIGYFIYLVIAAMNYGEEYRTVEKQVMKQPVDMTHKTRNWREKVMNVERDKEETDLLHFNEQHQEKMTRKAEAVLKEIPGFENVKIIPKEYYYNGGQRYREFRRRMCLVKMVLFAPNGKVPVEWAASWIFTKYITSVLDTEVSTETVITFFKWYEDTLKKNGYADADIRAKVVNGYPVEWHFAEGSREKNLQKMW